MPLIDTPLAGQAREAWHWSRVARTPGANYDKRLAARSALDSLRRHPVPTLRRLGASTTPADLARSVDDDDGGEAA